MLAIKRSRQSKREPRNKKNLSAGAKNKSSSARRKRIMDQMSAFEKNHNPSRRARSLAEKRGLSTSSNYFDFGRELIHYLPVHEMFLQFAGRPKGKKVIHLASSTGVYTRFLQGIGCKAVGLDISKDAVSISRGSGNERVVQASARMGAMNIGGKTRPGLTVNNLPFKDSYFDVFMSDHFLFAAYPELERGVQREHTGSREGGLGKSLEALRELNRILKPNGVGIIYHHYPHMLSKKLMGQVKKMGFKVEYVRAYPTVGLFKSSADKHQDKSVMILRKTI